MHRLHLNIKTLEAHKCCLIQRPQDLTRISSQALELLPVKYTHFYSLSDFSVVVKRQHAALQPLLALNLQASCLHLLTAEITGVCRCAPWDKLIYRKDQLYEISEDQSLHSNAIKKLDKWDTCHHHSSPFKTCTGAAFSRSRLPSVVLAHQENVSSQQMETITEKHNQPKCRAV